MIDGQINIGPREQRKRKVAGWVGLVLAALASAALPRVVVPRWWTIGLFLPSWFGLLCVIQAYAGT